MTSRHTLNQLIRFHRLSHNSKPILCDLGTARRTFNSIASNTSQKENILERQQKIAKGSKWSADHLELERPVDLQKARRVLYPPSSEFPTIDEVSEYESLAFNYSRVIIILIVVCALSMGFSLSHFLFPSVNQKLNLIDESNESEADN